MSSLAKTINSSTDSRDFVKGYFNYLNTVLNRISEEEVVAFMHVLFEARERGSTIFFMGNGGSAATASHFANDIGIGTRSWTTPFRAMSLTDNNAIMTAIGNDYGYEDVFLKQLQVLMKPNDVVVTISASGNSMNLVRAVEYANKNLAITVGLTAFDGGKLKQLSKYGIHVPCNKGEYGPAEDAHMIIDHLVHAYLSMLVKKEMHVEA
jgi:D-sedoheptulose 7-phosphate isomerase